MPCARISGAVGRDLSKVGCWHLSAVLQAGPRTLFCSGWFALKWTLGMLNLFLSVGSFVEHLDMLLARRVSFRRRETECRALLHRRNGVAVSKFVLDFLYSLHPSPFASL